MIDLIRADLRRILRKRSFLLVLVVSAAIAVLLILWNKAQDVWNGFAFAVSQRAFLKSWSTLLLGIAVFSGIYADEFRARSMQAVIGRGMSRAKVIAAKIIDCTLLTALVYAFFLAFLLLMGHITDARMTPDDLRILVLSAVSGAYIVALCAPAAAITLYRTDNIPAANVTLVVLLAVLPGTLRLMEMTVLFHNLRPTHYYIEGIADRAFSDMLLGGGGILTLAAGAAIYLGLSFLLSLLVFGKKELEF